MPKTLRQEILEVRAHAAPRGQLAIDWLLAQTELADAFNGAAQMCLRHFLEGTADAEVRRISHALLRQTEFTGHVLGREFQAL